MASKTYYYIFVNISLSIFNSGLEDLLIKHNIFLKPLFCITVIIVGDSIDISQLNNILRLDDCVGEILTLEVVFRYCSCK